MFAVDFGMRREGFEEVGGRKKLFVLRIEVVGVTSKLIFRPTVFPRIKAAAIW
jgi:hypothetical protein